MPDFSHVPVSHNSSDVDSFVGVSTTAHSSKETYLLPQNISKPKPVTDVVRRGDQVKGVAQFIEAEGNGAGQPGQVPMFQRVVSRNLFLFNGATPGEVTPLPRPLKFVTIQDLSRDYPRPADSFGCVPVCDASDMASPWRARRLLAWHATLAQAMPKIGYASPHI